MVVFYGLSIVTTIVLSSTVWPQFTVECLRHLNQQGVGPLWEKFGVEWIDRCDVSQILTRSGRDVGLSYAKEIFCRYSTLTQTTF